MADSSESEPWILQFDSIHHVLAAEDMFIERGIWRDLVPTPRDVNSDCGMVIEFRRCDWGQVCELISELQQGPRGIYRFTGQGYEQVDQ